MTTGEAVSAAIGRLSLRYVPEGSVVYRVGLPMPNDADLGPILDARRATIRPIEADARVAAYYVGPGAECMQVENPEACHYEDAGAVLFLFALSRMGLPERRTLIRRLLPTIRPGGAIIILDEFEGPGGYGAIVARDLARGMAFASSLDFQAWELRRPLREAEVPEPRSLWFCLGLIRGYVVEAPGQ